MRGRRHRASRTWRRCGGSLSACGIAAPLRCVFCRVRGRIPTDRVGWTWAEPRESYPEREPVAAFHCPHRLYPSAWEALPASGQALAKATVPPAHHVHCPATERRLRPFEHPRQPYEFLCSNRRGTCQWLAVRFFFSTSAVRMDLARGRVQREGFNLDAHDL